MEAPEFTLEKTAFSIKGTCRSLGDNHLYVDGKELTNLADSQAIRNHSPDGPAWGYGGSGPAQAALMICLNIFGNKHVAQALYQDFKQNFVAKWGKNGESFEAEIDITDFLIEHRDRLKQALQQQQ
ncbi:hypothetical protein GCM10023189_32740 [Nibrella saemangeumensis]|uniref:Uncharacterized protein n=1 Tax=Nibrella saemangeumensis TaxID=1084526 RepID=A0ABP8N354_9BACT